MGDLEAIAAAIAGDAECPFLATRIRPVPGEGPPDARVVFVGEAPGAREDEAGRPLVGNAGRMFDRWLEAAGLKRERVFVTNLLKCRPPENRAPRAAEVRHCLPYLHRQIDAIRPTVVCPMGSHAVRALLGKEAKLTVLHGKPQQQDGVIYIPLYHPASVYYKEDLKAAAEADFAALGEWLRAQGLA